MPSRHSTLTRQLDAIREGIETLGGITWGQLDELLDRQDTTGAHSGSGVHVKGGDHADPTMLAAIAGPRDDEIALQITEALASLSEGLNHLRRYKRLSWAVRNQREPSEAPSQCLACDRSVAGTRVDRIKSGYCPACYESWRRWARQQDEDGVDASHVVFRIERRKGLDAGVGNVLQ